MKTVVVVHGIGMGDGQSRKGFSFTLRDSVLSKCTETEKPEWVEAIWEGENDRIDGAVKKTVTLCCQQNLSGTYIADAIDLLGDAPLYLTTTQGVKIRAVVTNIIRQYPNCILVGHSLGSVICYDILQHAMNSENSEIAISSLITFGSPLDLLAKMDLTTKPVAYLNPFPFPWTNFYYPKDAICVFRKLSNEKFPGVANRELTSSKPFTSAHLAYWDSETVANSIYSMLDND